MIAIIKISTYIGISSEASHYLANIKIMESEFVINPQKKEIKDRKSGEIINIVPDERINKDILAFSKKEHFNEIYYGKTIDEIHVLNSSIDECEKLRQEELNKFDFCYSDESNGFTKFITKKQAIDDSINYVKNNYPDLEYVIMFRGKIIG